MDGVLSEAQSFAVTRAALRDLLRAKFLIDNAGLSPSPVTAVRSAQDILSRLSENPGAALALAETLPKESAARLIASAWYKKAAESAAALVAEDEDLSDTGVPVLGRNLDLGSLAFREVPGGDFISTGAFPRRDTVGDFWMALTVVNQASWEAFISTNPDWNIQNTANLTEQGLATEDYLGPSPRGASLDVPGEASLDVPGEASRGAGVSGLSWYAAEAYCRWLSALLPPDLASYEVRLPTEAEWEYAAKSFWEIRNSTGIFWEWCRDHYAPLDFLSVPTLQAELFNDRRIAQAGSGTRIGSPERSLRGGSWINPPPMGLETRASLPPAFCSPFVSFRPVIALRQGVSHE
jgi:formylglycine-generating enzyme required for sulfatase activity